MSNEVLDRINQTDSLLGSSQSKLSPATRSTASFNDGYGDETYFVENISSMDVILGDLGGTPQNPGSALIERGTLIDLLQRSDLADLKKSKHLRTCMADGFLLRLTQEQFNQKFSQKEDNARRIAKAREDAKNRPASDTSVMRDARFSTKNQVDRLKMFYSNDKDISAHGLTPYEFMEWSATEKFEDGEIDYIVSMIDNADVRSFLYKRKAQLFG
jgi:hypothetical protein